MTSEALSFTRSFSIALLALLEAMAPPAVSVGLLYGLCLLYDTEFKGFFVVLAILVGALSVLLPPPRSRPPGTRPLLSPGWPLALRVLARWMVIIGVLLAIGFVTKYTSDFSRKVVVSWIVATPAVLILMTLCLQELRRRLMYDPSMVRRVAFAGCNEISLSLARRIGESGELTGLTVEGFFDDRSAERLGVPGASRARLLGRLPELASFVKRRRIDVVFVALPVRHIRRVMQLLDELRDTTVSIYYVPDIFAFDLIQARSGELFGIPVVALCETPFCGYRGVVKRITDIAFAASILVIAAPLMVALAVMVRMSSPGPIIFAQRRYGLDGREITVWKYRTMMVLEDGERIVQASKHDARITAVGRFMRRYSLDELPQLFNVLQGRMSLVGPRPHAVAHNEEYRKLIKGYMIRHKVPPGMTGLAQVSGCRGETARVEDMQARVNFDLEYLRKWTPLLDLKILLLTAVRLLRDEKAY
ncbi:MAG TPA: undecaprenyl-phosphate glucose phosphotransferase [Steroidobacteraceae bacterium]|jgi:putative colanic acid biosynthesis UDP-glucose lipid carrier transferase|nr:undecaprenyl-phosphate glucose phosphotransferase [Steroidobacteraceae bacterium]